MSLTGTATRKLNELDAHLRDIGPLVVGWSGGVDSTLLIAVAQVALGKDLLAVTADSASLPAAELDQVREFARDRSVNWRLARTAELDDPRYLRNEADRCYWCKQALFDVMAPLATEMNATMAIGTIMDDLGDHRPGQQAAAERAVAAPLVDCGFTKEDVRVAAAEMGLPVWDKPASACLASRVPYGSPITVELLSSVERAEAALRGLGFYELRVRHHGDVARIEIPPRCFDAVLANSEQIVAELEKIGFVYVALDLAGLRSGSMNRPLLQEDSLNG